MSFLETKLEDKVCINTNAITLSAQLTRAILKMEVLYGTESNKRSKSFSIPVFSGEGGRSSRDALQQNSPLIIWIDF